MQPARGEQALRASMDSKAVDRQAQGDAVRYSLEVLERVCPGHAVEVRVPPFAAAQCVEGPRHTRGTPPNVVEMPAETWLEILSGELTWQEALATHRVQASGNRSDLTDPIARLRDALDLG